MKLIGHKSVEFKQVGLYYIFAIQTLSFSLTLRRFVDHQSSMFSPSNVMSWFLTIHLQFLSALYLYMSCLPLLGGRHNDFCKYTNQ